MAKTENVHGWFQHLVYKQDGLPPLPPPEILVAYSCLYQITGPLFEKMSGNHPYAMIIWYTSNGKWY